MACMYALRVCMDGSMDGRGREDRESRPIVKGLCLVGVVMHSRRRHSLRGNRRIHRSF